MTWIFRFVAVRATSYIKRKLAQKAVQLAVKKVAQAIAKRKAKK